MSGIFRILFLIGYLMWIILDYRKIKKARSKSMMVMYYTINAVTLLLFISLLVNYRPPTPVSILNNTVYYWVKAWTGEIYYVNTGH
ncbi:hypothetical protein [Paenibacillus sp. J2TS4]|uniref:hypothetical protein n=1 Tax=Paenibacillus sp. J2TS4 TaxID=2807194 RepID=UPI001B2D9751|nr:hypothetical protein [Paenibacillus sp. J2TS4]GIP34035.1 hypothetical protein J2TS4_32450 [Paenibacillus sp. J2TS4]